MKFGFIGIGKIASAVIEGFCTAHIKELEIFISPRNEDNAKKLAKTFRSVNKMMSNQAVIDHADFIFLSVKPDQIREVINTLTFHSHQHIISFIPFLEYQELAALTKPAISATRTIPLPSVTNHNCPIPVFGGNDEIIEIFKFIGQPLILSNESELHTIWTLTGLISPFYDLMGSLSSWSITNGVDPGIANQYTADLFQSLAFAAQKTKPVNFEELSWHAATPNGLNEQASKEINNAGAHEIYKNACDNIMERIKNRS